MAQTTSSDLLTYRNQIYNFVQTLSIKMSAMADACNVMVQLAGYDFDDTDPTTWKYYMNLAGQYHPSDTVMTVTSLDTQQVMEFTPQNLLENPRTASVYIPGSSYYTKLCAKYPGQTDLIKSIVFPVESIEDAIEADDFTLLAYGSNFLEANESGYLINELNIFLDQIGSRWYFTFYSYEPYYFVSFWGQMWHRIIEMLFAARFKAIRTIHVHSWHIWQYLTSNGLGDYSDYLTREQAMFLYRNFDYIQQRQGTASNLSILANELLAPIGVGLYGRDIYQQTLTAASTCELTPELVAVKVPADYASITETVPADSISDAMIRMVEAGLDVNDDADYVSQMTRTLGDTTLNTLPTKIMEIRPLDTTKQYADFFNRFVMDSLVYLVSVGKYNTNIELYPSDSSTTIELSVNDALIFLYYCIHRASRETPVNIPTMYTSQTAFNIVQPTIPTLFNFDGFNYYISNYVDLPNYANVIYPKYTLTTPQDFSDTVSTLFMTALTQVIDSRRAMDAVQEKMMRYVSSLTCVQGTVPLKLSDTITTYPEWIAAHPDVYKRYINLIDAYADPAPQYSSMADQILTLLIPITPTMQQYGNFQITNNSYAMLKQLFIQLCSYNIAFLDTTRDVFQHLYINNPTLYRKSLDFSETRIAPTGSFVDPRPEYGNAIELPTTDLEFSVATEMTSTVTAVSSPTVSVVSDKTSTIYRPSQVVSKPVQQPVTTKIVLDSFTKLYVKGNA